MRSEFKEWPSPTFFWSLGIANLVAGVLFLDSDLKGERRRLAGNLSTFPEEDPGARLRLSCDP